jgi:hypothetical protein
MYITMIFYRIYKLFQLQSHDFLFNSHALFIYKSVVICWLASFEIYIYLFLFFISIYSFS